LPLYLVIAAVLFGAGILFYSQTSAFTGDEGFHLLAAQLIDKGMRPYIDFAFPQTPLNAYFNALSLRLFGQTWRVPHAISSLLAIGAAMLAAQFVWRRFPASEKWRAAASLTTLIAISMNVMVVQYGPLAQAYAICLLLTAAAFRLAVIAVDRVSPWAALTAGLCAGAAAASSLLTATAAPVYLLWMLVYNRAGKRSIKTAAYCLGGVIPFAPAFWLWLQSPRPVMFNLFEYHLSFRTLYWPKTTQHDLEIMTSWIDSGQALLLMLLSLAGLLFVIFRSNWELSVRREYYLCGWLTFGMCAEIATAHPTFARYFILVVPFVAILAAMGLYAISERLYRPEAPYAALALFTLLFALGLGKSLYERSNNVRTWAVHEQMAKKVDEVTPRDAPIFADEEIYFLTRRTPPRGLEFSYSHKLKLPPALAAQLHIVDQDQINRMAAEGKFAAVATCDDEFLDAMHLDDIYKHKFVTDDCYVYWGHAHQAAGLAR
jgi:hypothetical protein